MNEGYGVLKNAVKAEFLNCFDDAYGVGIKLFKVVLHNLRIPILFKDCPLGVSEKRRSRNEHSNSKNISE